MTDPYQRPPDSEIRRKITAHIAREAGDSLQGWYLSFAGEEGFRGVVIQIARGYAHAIQRAHELGINPGGEVQGIPIPPKELDKVPPEFMDRLLSREDIKSIPGW